MESILEKVQSGDADILVGTQMLAKGHHFPNVTLVGIIDADSRLYGIDFRSGERMAQLILQVAGRAGRENKPGEVIIQTHHPDHPLLTTLIEEGYEKFAEDALEERREAGLPPSSFMALLRAESTDRAAPSAFLERAASKAGQIAGPEVHILGPVPAPMEKRAGRYRAQLLLQADTRSALQQMLGIWVPLLQNLGPARKVRWSLDVDPHEML
jgi:primosomal protein N' (replication factor Y)